jgi:hypothetical protein
VTTFDRHKCRAWRQFGETGRAAAVAVVGWLVSGCGPPQIGVENREIVLALATATSAENPGWLEQCAGEIESSRTSGTLTEAEDRAFSAILDLARAGRWAEARDDAYALRDAQEPTAETIEAVKNRTLPEPKIPPPGRR